MASRPSGQLLDVERVWSRNTQEAWDILTPLTTEKSKAAIYWRTRSEWTSAKSHYDRLLVPARFLKAGDCFALAFEKGILAIDLYSEASQTGRDDLRDKALACADEYDVMRTKGFEEMRAAGG